MADLKKLIAEVREQRDIWVSAYGDEPRKAQNKLRDLAIQLADALEATELAKTEAPKERDWTRSADGRSNS